MKQIWKEIGLAVILGMVLPGISLYAAVHLAQEKQNEPPSTEVGSETRALHNETEIQVQMDDGSIESMQLESYITGVVLAEMPATFEPEALKAQGVVARTYTMRAHNGKSKHENAAVCTDSTCCQAYLTAEEYLNSGGKAENLEKVRSTVLDTAGFVLTYDGALIEATYFSCSGGSTEDAVAVWGTDVPYLIATDSPGEEGATHYSDTDTFTLNEFLTALSLESDSDPQEWFGPVTYTAGGGVERMEICGETFTGTELRSLLGLRSTAVTFTVDDDSIQAHTRGFGHRVGMSQYGADAMAIQGNSYQQILAHYYRGTTLEKLAD